MPPGTHPAGAVQCDKPQILTRIPPWRPQTWVKLKDITCPIPVMDLSGQVRQVRDLVCRVDHAGVATWTVHFNDGRMVKADQVLRAAKPSEIAAAEGRHR